MPPSLLHICTRAGLLPAVSRSPAPTQRCLCPIRGVDLAAQLARVLAHITHMRRLWRRIIADSFQLPLRFPTEPESAALGAALQAAAVHAGQPVADFVQSHQPPLSDDVSHPLRES